MSRTYSRSHDQLHFDDTSNWESLYDNDEGLFSDRQDGMISPADFNYRDCPTMHKPKARPLADDNMEHHYAERNETSAESDTDQTSGTYSTR